MNYNINFRQFANQMLPPVLRGTVIKALLFAMIAPIIYLYDSFMNYKDSIDKKLHITANVQYIEKALNDALDQQERRIRLTEPDESTNKDVYFYHEAEEMPAHYLRLESEEADSIILYNDMEASHEDDFTVFVPPAIISEIPPQSQSDKTTYRQLITILDTYKPAGRSYKIEIDIQ